MVVKNKVRDFLYEKESYFIRGACFDGVDDYVTMGDVLDFDSTDPFSLSVWLKRNSTGSSLFPISKQSDTGGGDDGNRGWAMRVLSSDVVAFMLTNSSWAGENMIGVTGTKTLDLMKWYHVVITYDGSTKGAGVSMYIDGLKDSPLTVSQDTLTGVTTTAFPLNIGARNNASDFFDGTIDEVRIYNYALAISSIEKLYNAGARKFQVKQ